MEKRSAVLAVANQKGGVAKTTTVIMTAYLLSQKYKVLAVDLDGQSDLTEAMTEQASVRFDGETILEAMLARDARPYIKKITDTLDLIPSNDLITNINEHLYGDLKKGERSLVLEETLATVWNDYDWVILDAAPSLDLLMTNCLSAADYVVIPFKPSPFCAHALERFMETIETVQEMTNPELKVIGILLSMIDLRRSDVRSYISYLNDLYGDLVFKTIIKQAASRERFTIGSFFTNPETLEAVEPFAQYLEELLERIGGTT